VVTLVVAAASLRRVMYIMASRAGELPATISSPTFVVVPYWYVVIRFEYKIVPKPEIALAALKFR
jgi:hypothetical protein